MKAWTIVWCAARPAEETTVPMPKKTRSSSTITPAMTQITTAPVCLRATVGAQAARGSMVLGPMG